MISVVALDSDTNIHLHHHYTPFFISTIFYITIIQLLCKGLISNSSVLSAKKISFYALIRIYFLKYE
ncbi:hypothetical protein B14911_20000 [Bacillus sp. NRRL B-14911]|nr:hypothetical protein B14911_20000 [Bacillus sp. NRRL B-14911]